MYLYLSAIREPFVLSIESSVAVVVAVARERCGGTFFRARSILFFSFGVGKDFLPFFSFLVVDEDNYFMDDLEGVFQRRQKPLQKGIRNNAPMPTPFARPSALLLARRFFAARTTTATTTTTTTTTTQRRTRSSFACSTSSSPSFPPHGTSSNVTSVPVLEQHKTTLAR